MQGNFQLIMIYFAGQCMFFEGMKYLLIGSSGNESLEIEKWIRDLTDTGAFVIGLFDCYPEEDHPTAANSLEL